MRQEFRLPDVGEGLTEAEVVAWRVAPGDPVAVNDVLVEVESAKSVVELPSPFAGTVAALLVEPGRTVPVPASRDTSRSGPPSRTISGSTTASPTTSAGRSGAAE